MSHKRSYRINSPQPGKLSRLFSPRFLVLGVRALVHCPSESRMTLVYCRRLYQSRVLTRAACEVKVGLEHDSHIHYSNNNNNKNNSVSILAPHTPSRTARTKHRVLTTDPRAAHRRQCPISGATDPEPARVALIRTLTLSSGFRRSRLCSFLITPSVFHSPQ